MPAKFLPQSTPVILYGIGLTIVLFFAWQFGFRYFALSRAHELSSASLFFISRLGYWVFAGIIYWYATRAERQPLLLWPNSREKAAWYIKTVLLILMSTVAGTIIIGLSLKYMGFKMDSNAIKTMLKFSVPLKLLAVVTAAFTEELIFRGYLIPRLQLYLNNRHAAIIFAAALFGLGHMGYGTAVNMLVPLFIGLLFGYHYYRYRNIAALIICHFIIDFVSLILSKGY
jgi:membrane protease YdiL (CAAX protease family)